MRMATDDGIEREEDIRTMLDSKTNSQFCRLLKCYECGFYFVTSGRARLVASTQKFNRR